MKMKTYICIGVFLAVSMLRAQGGSYKVVVNAANPVASITKAELVDLFLKKATAWENGEKVSPVDLSENSSARMGFSKLVLGKTIDQIKAYWNYKIFSGLDTPPPVMNTDRAVLDFISENRYAIGYISSATTVDNANIKVIAIR
jgi:ABC-type phosphate transport system substrate-binding protein